jgi:hypothetical protein
MLAVWDLGRRSTGVGFVIMGKRLRISGFKYWVLGSNIWALGLWVQGQGFRV